LKRLVGVGWRERTLFATTSATGDALGALACFEMEVAEALAAERG
jgi:hypothetical protein